MKKLVSTSLMVLMSMFCYSQSIYQVKVDILKIGDYTTDSTATWRDSVLVGNPLIMIYKDSLVIDGCTTYKFLSANESVPAVNSFFSVEQKTNKTYVVVFYKSSCLDNVSMSVIIYDDKKYYDYLGKME